MTPIARDRTAMSRTDLSRPLRCAIDHGLLNGERSLFDFGCGRGDDLRLLGAEGYDVQGWDPAHRPDTSLQQADVVNLGYVVNVIECPRERTETLARAWNLAQKLLVVSARTSGEDRDFDGAVRLSDGIVTSRNTFQKFYEQAELKHWIETSLGVEAIAAGLGIFYVFRDGEEAEAFRASRARRRISTPRLQLYEQRCHENPALVEALVRFFTQRGRVPAVDEIAEGEALESIFGSIKRAFAAVRRNDETISWEAITEARREDLLLFLALSQFERGKRWSALSLSYQRDIRALFGTYAAGQRAANALLLSLGEPGAIDRAILDAPVGKRTPTALYVHHSALDQLPLLLRMFAGVAQGYLGAVEGATIIKLYRHEPKISYLAYPTFDTDAHPALDYALNINLREFQLKRRRYAGQPNPPILHRKECFVADDYPRREIFAALTLAEEFAGLMDETSTIGLRRGWNAVLAAKGLVVEGHDLRPAVS